MSLTGQGKEKLKSKLLKGDILGVCDMCGAEEENLVVALIEGTELIVCKNCAQYGKILRKVNKPFIEEKTEKKVVVGPEKEIIDMIVNDYAERIRKKREKLGLKQEDFAKMISEKESLVHKMEIGEFKPSIDLARKLEKKLEIKLIEQYEEEFKPEKRLESKEVTIGDVINIRKRKNV